MVIIVLSIITFILMLKAGINFFFAGFACLAACIIALGLSNAVSDVVATVFPASKGRDGNRGS